MQDEAKATRRPWDMSKGFDQSAPCAPLSAVADVGHIDRGAIWLTVNGTLRQQGDIRDLIWSVPETIAYLSGLVELAAGDLIYTEHPTASMPSFPATCSWATSIH